MTSNRRRKQTARAYQAAHGVDYTTARRATESAPRQDRRQRALATLALPRREVCSGLMRAIDARPLGDPFVESLVEHLLETIDAVMPPPAHFAAATSDPREFEEPDGCLLYTSDAADE